MFRMILITAAVGLITACASSSAGARASSPSLRGAHDFVAIDELRRYEDTGSLFEALTRLRPHMVRTRFGPSTRGGMQTFDVFINGQYAGGPEVLRSLQATYVMSVRLMQRSQGYTTLGAQLRGDHALFVTLLRK